MYFIYRYFHYMPRHKYCKMSKKLYVEVLTQQHLSNNWIFIAKHWATEWRKGTHTSHEQEENHKTIHIIAVACVCVWRCYSWTTRARWLRLRYDITMVHVTIFLPPRYRIEKLHLNRLASMYWLHALIYCTHAHFMAVCRLKLAPITITRADYKFKNQFKYFIICFSSVIHSIDRSRLIARSFACSDGRPHQFSVQIVIYRCFKCRIHQLCMHACLNYIIT